MSVTTDWCVIGFPKCGTTALAKYFNQSSRLHLAKMNGAWEAPFFFESDHVPQEAYKDGLSNGHKFSAYIYNLDAVRKIYSSNSDVLLIVCIRDPRESLLSWRRMHKRIANQEVASHHFVNKTKESQEFYSNCTIEEYYDHYARRRLRYSHFIRNVRLELPEARIKIVEQSRLAANTRRVMSILHACLGLSMTNDDLEQLPDRPHASFGRKKLHQEGLPDAIEDELLAEKRQLESLISEFDQDAVI